jgi:exopolysaccharide production protein ExoZ
MSTFAPAPKTYFTSLQAGRGLAALMVVFYHNTLTFQKNWGHDPAQGFFGFGEAGVAFFFVLSGFIISFVHWRDLGQPRRLLPFLRRRFFRIYPIYWLLLAGLIPLYFLAPHLGTGHERELLWLISSITLLHFDQVGQILPVAWTLSHEILFYALFALTLLHKRLGFFCLGLWFVLCLMHFDFSKMTGLGSQPKSSVQFYFAPINLLFAVGIATYAWRQRLTQIPSLALIIGGGLLCCGSLWFNHGLAWLSHDSSFLLFGMGSALALLGLMRWEQDDKLALPQWLKFCGDASYSIYLTHTITLSLFAKIFFALRLQNFLPPLLAYILMPLAAIGAGMIFYSFIEKRLLRSAGSRG